MFFSDLLSSDYVEIHYEGGKPVVSKVMSSVVLTKTFFLILAESGSLFPLAGTKCPTVFV